jgi:hypothetical protein
LIFAIVACVACASLTLFAFRAAGGQDQVDEITGLRERMRRGTALSAERTAGALTRQLAEVLVALESASSRQAAVAVLNEFTFELESSGPRGPEVPRGLGRACFSVGFLLGALALADALQEAPELNIGRLSPGLVAIASGGVSGIFCYQIGQVASRRRRAYYDGARSLVSAIKTRIPGG